MQSILIIDNKELTGNIKAYETNNKALSAEKQASNIKKTNICKKPPLKKRGSGCKFMRMSRCLI